MSAVELIACSYVSVLIFFLTIICSKNKCGFAEPTYKIEVTPASPLVNEQLPNYQEASNKPPSYDDTIRQQPNT